jgi:FtsH-binding integral membrane protein
VCSSDLLAYAAFTAGIGIIGKAFLAAVAMFAGLAIYGATTRRNLMGLGGLLMASLLGLVMVSLISLLLHFFGIQVWNNTLELIFSGVGILVFAGFTAFDFQRILRRQNISSPMEAAIELFLDFILLFQNILRLILSLSKD